jgi:plasmid stabilization system protein ParE
VREVPFLPAARAEFFDALARYTSENPTLGADFLAEVERATQRISTFPDHGSPYLGGTRRVLLRRFRYSVVYEPGSDESVIVAVAHHSRRPGYWRGRIG